MSDITTVHPRWVELTSGGLKVTINVDEVVGVFDGGSSRTKVETTASIVWVDEDYETVKRLMDPIYYLDTK